ncbi:hypothetical protein BGZ65_002643 [Modicella reniformis]|uniref:Uncharacterized protein n=1 Tax=Modicella reniformis TaxID=1440133 RepID=A0A9P6IL99_9FUNG|nr:hypothetical protein BGZ65_002643 [Modicella reniformis]
MTWKKGYNIDPSLYRTGMACAVVGTSFVAWGGDNNWNNMNQLAVPVIYDLKADQWTSVFTSTNIITGDVNQPTTSGQGKEDDWVVIGTVIAAAVLILIGFGILRYRSTKYSKQRKANRHPEGENDDLPNGHGRANLSDSGNSNPSNNNNNSQKKKKKKKNKVKDKDGVKDKHASKNIERESLQERRRSPQSLAIAVRNDDPLSFSVLSSPHSIIPTSPTHHYRQSHEDDNENNFVHRISENSDHFNRAEPSTYNKRLRGSVHESSTPPSCSLPYSLSSPFQKQQVASWSYSRSINPADERNLLMIKLNAPHNPAAIPHSTTIEISSEILPEISTKISSEILPEISTKILSEVPVNSKDDVVVFRHKGPYIHDSSCILEPASRRHPQEHAPGAGQRVLAGAHGAAAGKEEAQRRGNKLSRLQNQMSAWFSTKVLS